VARKARVDKCEEVIFGAERVVPFVSLMFGDYMIQVNQLESLKICVKTLMVVLSLSFSLLSASAMPLRVELGSIGLLNKVKTRLLG
jgi:hypothetical protein